MCSFFSTSNGQYMDESKKIHYRWNPARKRWKTKQYTGGARYLVSTCLLRSVNESSAKEETDGTCPSDKTPLGRRTQKKMFFFRIGPAHFLRSGSQDATPIANHGQRSERWFRCRREKKRREKHGNNVHSIVELLPGNVPRPRSSIKQPKVSASNSKVHLNGWERVAHEPKMSEKCH